MNDNNNKPTFSNAYEAVSYEYRELVESIAENCKMRVDDDHDTTDREDILWQEVDSGLIYYSDQELCMAMWYREHTDFESVQKYEIFEMLQDDVREELGDKWFSGNTDEEDEDNE